MFCNLFSLAFWILSLKMLYKCIYCRGTWKEKKFKPYNFEAMGIAPDCGHLHPLMKVRTQFRQIFLEMGWAAGNPLKSDVPRLPYKHLTRNSFFPLYSFSEMPTNNFIESSFWNFDALFQPQQHPARDQHDTFFLSGKLWTGRASTTIHSPVQMVCGNQWPFFRPRSRPPVPFRLPGQSEESPLRRRLWFTRVRRDHKLK